LDENPAPDSYRLKSSFEFERSNKGMSKKLSVSFGAPREAFDKVYVPSNKINTDKDIPGPGHYTLLSNIG
jgi:hypothetical protein